MSRSRGIPTSRAYWELRAEQVLNRVFEAERAIEVEVLEHPAAPPAPARPAPPGAPSAVALAGLGLTALIGTGGSLLLISLWSQSQQALRQERTLLLLERLRHLGPAAAPSSDSATVSETSGGAAAASSEGLLPPPPPQEPWVEELASLPSSGAPTAEPLRVPLAGPLSLPPPAVSGGGGGAAAGSAPQLVGVVQVSGRHGSAIFQLGGSSTSAGVGESIGSSGWRLLSTSGDSAVIERGGEQRRLSISGGF